MDNLTLADLWAEIMSINEMGSLPDDEIEKYKLLFYAGAYALINRNHYLQTHCESKNEYIEAMTALQKECLYVHGVDAEPEKKPFLKIVK